MVFGTKKRLLISAISFLTPIIFCTLILNPASSLTYKSPQRLDFTLEPTIQLTLSSSTLLVSDLAINTYNDSNTINILAGTNVSAGMQLTATVGSTNNPSSDLTQSGSTNIFTSIATNANLANLGASQDTNIWGYSYKDSNTATWANYNGLPIYGNAGAVLLDTSDITDSTINFKIAAKAGGTQASGSYTNNINFSAVAKVIATSYTISFQNGGDDVTNWPTDVSGSDSTGQGATVTLSSLVPAKTGYSFGGWCTVATSNGSCTGNIYHPGDSYPIGAVGGTVAIDLYAMWRPTLYSTVASLVKLDSEGDPQTQVTSDLQAVITEPTTNNPATDESNSGVFLYNTTEFGVASDASNDYPIYYYRGQLDKTFASSDSYGGIPSTGDSYYYPNYVVLSSASNKSGLTTTDTCWRIVRTTGSGGVKMIYNGKWTGSTCANSGSNAAAGSTYFNRGAGFENTSASNCNTADNQYCGTLGFTTLVGYNYNSKYASDTTATTAISNSTLFNNETPSNLRISIENWYNNSSNTVLRNLSANGKLENSAGWCDDRSTTANPSTSDTTVPYSTSWLQFGARYRNVVVGGKLTLTCPDKTGNDLLTTSNGLGAPLAPLTADEASLIGHGFYHHYTTPNTGPDSPSQLSSNYSYASFGRSGVNFWLISPFRWFSDGVFVFYLNPNGHSNNSQTFWSPSLRPTISLTFGTSITDGNGTSTNPWIINP